MKPKSPPAPPEPSDYYTARIREHNWPPDWEPQGGHDAGAERRKEAALRASTAMRERVRAKSVITNKPKRKK